jgi:hypothetical protein
VASTPDGDGVSEVDDPLFRWDNPFVHPYRVSAFVSPEVLERRAARSEALRCLLVPTLPLVVPLFTWWSYFADVSRPWWIAVQPELAASVILFACACAAVVAWLVVTARNVTAR